MEMCELEPADCGSAQPSASSTAGPDVGERPCQPRRASFPKVSFGKTAVKTRAFQPAWFDKWPWLHWDNSSERVFCHVCVRAVQAGKLSTTMLTKHSCLVASRTGRTPLVCSVSTSVQSATKKQLRRLSHYLQPLSTSVRC